MTNLLQKNPMEEVKSTSDKQVIEDFCRKISEQQDCPPEFVKIVNDEFWNLI